MKNITFFKAVLCSRVELAGFIETELLTKLFLRITLPGLASLYGFLKVYIAKCLSKLLFRTLVAIKIWLAT